MRVIWSGIGITAGAGKVGGTVASRNANGSYLKKRTKPANPNTTAQQVQRANFGYLTRQWKVLSPAQKNTWVEQAPNYPYKNKLGVTAKYTGFQLFAKTNMQLNAVTFGPIQTIGSPVAVAAVGFIEILTGSPTVMTVNIGFGIDNNLSTSVPADCSLIVRATAAQSRGKYAPKRSIFKQIDVEPTGVSTNALDIFPFYQAKFGTPIVGSLVFVEAFLVSTITGQTGKALIGSFQIT
jgi:hypothetical protein